MIELQGPQALPGHLFRILAELSQAATYGDGLKISIAEAPILQHEIERLQGQCGEPMRPEVQAQLASWQERRAADEAQTGKKRRGGPRPLTVEDWLKT